MESYIETDPSTCEPETGKPEAEVQPVSTESTVTPVTPCEKCGAPLMDGQEFCPSCGTPRHPKRICRSCGTELAADQQFCPKCGQKFGTAAEKDAPKANGKKKGLIIGACAAVAVALIVTVVLLLTGKSEKKFNFKTTYEKISYNSWCTIGSDGTWMKLDTNPDDIDSDEITWTFYTTTMEPCDKMIEQVNAELGFSSAVYAKMEETTWSQGRQTEKIDKFTVSWTYHPDKGLEVIYEVND